MTLLHFAHANGFPSPCYKLLFSALRGQLPAGSSITYIDRAAHTKQFQVSDCWPALVDEVLQSIRTQNGGAPVVGVGHSLGALLTVLAAMKEPALFRGVVMLDAPILCAFNATAVRIAKQLDLMDRITPAGQTKGRRRVWSSRSEALRYFRSRPLFAAFADDAIDAYMEGGLEQHDSIEGQLQLRFDPEIEYSIYRTLPHRFDDYGPLTVPTALIYGRESKLVTAGDRAHMARRYGIGATETAGGHLFPMEHPQRTAALVAQQLRRWDLIQ